MKKYSIGFIGGGNMASSIIGGLVADGFPANAIYVAEPNEEARSQLAARFGIHTEVDNALVAAQVDVLLLAVKPQVLRNVAEQLAASVQDKQSLVVSIAAGIRSSDLAHWLGGDVAIVRSMPNTPALVQSGATGLFANSHVSSSQREQAESILRAVGITVWLDDEQQIDAVTALSGSGPAYIFNVIEVMEKAGVKLGLDAETARRLAVQTAFGASKLALESSDEPAVLREKVTSPGGTTERALSVLRDGGLENLFMEALQAASDRAAELADQLGSKN
ncbi:MAG: pyrroline-5-carboxylate reductase [Sulfuriflexus sp.]|nr:pyrroline-5-carboxylate reductase [Sulfuriflexus sp.]